MKTPRDRFLESKFAKAHADLAVSDPFVTACEYAVLQFIHEQPGTTDATKHWDSHAQLVGARKVLDILKTLADPVAPPKTPVQEGLNYNLKK